MENDIEYREKEEAPNLYNIIGLNISVCKDEKCDEIIRDAFVKAAKKYHPDRNKNNSSELFELIVNAYDILKDKKQREIYNRKYVTNKMIINDFDNLKKNSKKYIESVGEYLPPTEEQKKNFEQKVKKLDEKHGYDETNSKAINKKDAKKKMAELLNNRTKQDMSFKHEKIFDDGRFDIERFNAVFDMAHKNKINDLMEYNNNGPSAWNSKNEISNYSAVDDIETLYIEDNNIQGNNYGRLDSLNVSNKVSREDIEKAKLSDVSYVKNHNLLDDNYYNDIKRKLRDRENDSKNYTTSVKYNDDAGYMFSEV